MVQSKGIVPWIKIFFVCETNNKTAKELNSDILRSNTVSGVDIFFLREGYLCQWQDIYLE